MVTKRTGKKRTISKSGKGKPKYSCQVCGLVVSVDEMCGCVDTCDIVCCGQEMMPKK